MGNIFYKSVEEKLSLAQEDLISNRNQIGNQNKLIQELKTAKATLEQDAKKKEQQLKEQSAVLQDIQKEKVFHFLTKSRILALPWPLRPFSQTSYLNKASPLFSTTLLDGLIASDKNSFGHWNFNSRMYLFHFYPFLFLLFLVYKLIDFSNLDPGLFKTCIIASQRFLSSGCTSEIKIWKEFSILRIPKIKN